MAFQKTITIQDGQIEVQNAYLKVTTIQTITEGTTDICNVIVNFYKDKESSDNKKKPLNYYTDNFIPQFGQGVLDIKAQAYESLKLKDFFKDAVNC